MKRMVETKAVELIEDMVAKNVTPEMILNPKMEEIVDADGHKRFFNIEGEYTPIEGIAITYKKASLSGTHIMFVIAGTVENGVTIPADALISLFNIPEWVSNKIVPVFATYIIDRKGFNLWGDDGTVQPVTIQLATSPNVVTARVVSSITATAKRSFRIQFDLLVD